ncbi:hypothetical protein GCM10027277_00280 [Pseudoduganella ginsengisoli]|uniref:Uncharacterized protein n=1 Tax=Pseudoduganella ginsengisoli TaxID=1462440 RepID=A0A6L6Q341_9BURK|nr:hypothetical protein [Pseudoduganella ginsengisoli]MTW03906.1 hypothetical protein [Pseudoduganella ginsengisoli]
MKRLDGMIAAAAIVLSGLALGGMVVTDEYAAAARTEARGMMALTHEVSGGNAQITPASLNGTMTASAAASAAVQQ